MGIPRLFSIIQRETKCKCKKKSPISNIDKLVDSLLDKPTLKSKKNIDFYKIKRLSYKKSITIIISFILLFAVIASANSLIDSNNLIINLKGTVNNDDYIFEINQINNSLYNINSNTINNESILNNESSNSNVDNTTEEYNIPSNKASNFVGLNISLYFNRSIYFIGENVIFKGTISYNFSVINSTFNISIFGPDFDIFEFVKISNGTFLYQFTPRIVGEYITFLNFSYLNESISKEIVFFVDNRDINENKIVIVNIEDERTIKTIQQDGEIGKPIKWTKEIIFENKENQEKQIIKNIRIPDYAEKINVFDESGKIVNNVKSQKYLQMNLLEISDILAPNERKKFFIYYTTPSPNSSEVKISPFKKIVTISSFFNYSNITAYADINNIPEDKIHLFHRIRNQKYEIDFTAIDLDNNSLIDRIEWIVPHLSTQTYEILIEIVKASHLDENRSYISDIYNETKSKDNNWSEPIYDKEYVRVTFESALKNYNDITIYARSNSLSKIEVYKKDSNILIDTFENITGEHWHQIYLYSMSGTEITFDLKTIGGYVEYDYIVDPTGWVSPTGHNDPGNQWTSETKAYDENTGSYASNNFGGSGWGQFLELTLSSAIYCDRFRVFSDFGYGIVDQVDIDIYNDTSWIDKYQGAISDCCWTEINFSAETNVTQARYRFHYTSGGYYFWLYEFDFWEGQPLVLPSCQTHNATSIDETSAILKGNVTDDGGEPCEYRFQYGLDTSYGNNTLWKGSETTDDEFGEIINGLSLGNIYHYRAQIKNSIGQINGTDLNFTTAVPPNGWVTPTGSSDPDSNWDDENNLRDDNTDTFARHYHDINDPDGQWSSYIYLNHSPIYCDGVRFYARGLTGDANQIDRADLDVNINGIWVDIFEASFTDKQWIECYFQQGTVDEARIRFRINRNNAGLYYELYEFDFNKSRPWPDITNESPSNQSTGVLFLPQMNITVKSPVGDNMNITWYSNSSGSWQIFAKNTSILNGTYYQINGNFSLNGTKFWWYVSVEDSVNTNTSDMFHFTTRYEAEVITNASMGAEETNATLYGYLLHDGDESCTVRFEYGTDTSYGTNTTNQTKVEGEEFFENINGLNPGNIYRYRAYANNSIEYDSGNDIAFLTKPNVTGNLEVEMNSSSILYLTWTKGDGANNTYIERNATGTSIWTRGTGVEVYNGTGTNYEDNGLNEGTNYYYQAWSYSTWTYDSTTLYQWSDENESANNRTNNLPTINVIYPTNGSIVEEIQPNCQIWANDTDGDTLDVYWYENSTGSWVLRNVNNSISSNSTVSYIYPQFVDFMETYYWKIAINDSTENISEWFNFTIEYNTSIIVTPSNWDIGVTSIGNYNYSSSDLFFNLTNNGTTTLDVQVKASNATNSITGSNWNLNSTPGFDNYSLLYNKSGDISWTNINQSYDIFINNLGVGLWETFDLNIFMATLSTKGDSLEIKVTFRSVAS